MLNMQENDTWVIFLQNKPILLQLASHYSTQKMTPGHYSMGRGALFFITPG
jgi:hypothetical protein